MGVTMQLPEADRHTPKKGFLETQVAVLMGGRVAEELFMNHMTSGASNDIERATEIAQHGVRVGHVRARAARLSASQATRSRPTARTESAKPRSASTRSAGSS